MISSERYIRDLEPKGDLTTPEGLEKQIARDIAVRLGERAASGSTFAAATKMEVAGFAEKFPDEHDLLRADVVKNLARQGISTNSDILPSYESNYILPENYKPLSPPTTEPLAA